MKSPHANPSELQALNAVPRAPFPLTPTAAAAKPAGAVKLAALKRLEDEERTLTDSVVEEGQALAQDGLSSEGAALEAIAPAPLPEPSFMDTLLAQAGPAAAGGGAAGGAGIPAGLVVGAVVVLAAAATGGSSSPAPAPAPAPAGPPNQPASINASEPMRTGFVIEDYVPGDGEMMVRDGDFEYTGTTGNTAATALKIVDADGGADLTFRAATAEELQGKYGNFTFDAATGLWTYTINNDDPDTQALGSGGRMMGRGKEGFAEAYDYLTVYSKDGTASTVIEVGVIGKGEPPVPSGDTEVTVGDGNMVLIDLSAQMEESREFNYYYTNYPDEGDLSVWQDGGFALYFASNSFDANYEDSFSYQVYSDNDNGRAYGDVVLNIVEAASSGESTPGFGDGSFELDATEGVASAISFSGMLEDADDDGDGMFTLILQARYAYDDGHFVMTADESVRILGNGTTEVALQGTLDALQDYLEDDKAKFVINSEYEANNIDFKTWFYDEQGNSAGSQQFYLDDFESVNELPVINAYIGEGHEASTVTYYVPATGTADAGSPYLLGNSFLYVQFEDEESSYDSYGDGDWVYLDISVDQGTLSLVENDGYTFFGNYSGNVAVWNGSEWVNSGDLSELITDVESLTLRGQYYPLSEAVNRFLGYQGPESFAAGSQATLTLEFTDAGDQTATQQIPLVASIANTGPFYSVTSDFSFPDFAIVTQGEGEDGPATRLTTATATLDEDQHLTFTGIAVNDFESTGASNVGMYIYAYEFYMIDDERDTDNNVGLFYMDEAWQDLVDYNYYGGIALYGSIDDINAMFAAGGLHYALPPDYDANRVYVEQDAEYEVDLAFNIDLYDLESTGYGYGSAMLQIDIDLAAVNDIPLVLGDAEQYVSYWFDGDFEYLDIDDMLRSDAVFDAEYNGNGDGGTLDITSVVLVAGTGTGTLNFVEGDVDGEWQYTFGEGDMPGDIIEFTYGYSDGTYSGTNTLNLILEEVSVIS